ncbi:hypothetical protein [Actinacidiphila acididurans]|uniref:Uncharacterized protein n=1 Tax=Actinacidiphila acididurans TaxID=2784346 RepID=A0ABS2TJ64_9ACTN|nr:hypothetical protein [Actinacidiphila acididurans]MBM9503391.1 hypothetical protein [Actinacidiphila acididurans]
MDGGGHGGDSGGHGGGHDGGHGGHGGHSGGDWAHHGWVTPAAVDKAMDVLSALLDVAGDVEAPEHGHQGERDRDVAAAADRVASGLSRMSQFSDGSTQAQERALALWRRTGDRERELDALMYLTEHRFRPAAGEDYGRQAEALARETGDPFQIARALRARGAWLVRSRSAADNVAGAQLLLVAAESAVEALHRTDRDSDRGRQAIALLERCCAPAVETLMSWDHHAEAAAAAALFIAQDTGVPGWWTTYRRAREEGAKTRETRAGRSAAEWDRRGRPADAAAQLRGAAAAAWQDRGDRPAALARLEQAQRYARLAGEAVTADDAAALTALAGQVRSVTWSRAAFKAHRDAVTLHRRHHDADAAWQALVAARAVAGARTAVVRRIRPRTVRFKG